MTMSEYKNTGHKLYFVIEDGELVECSCEHPQECMMSGTYADSDHPYEEPDPMKCDIAHVEEWEPLSDMDLDHRYDTPWHERQDGAYEVDIEHYFQYWAPSYPDYEADIEFSWRPTGEVRNVVLSHE